MSEELTPRPFVGAPAALLAAKQNLLRRPGSRNPLPRLFLFFVDIRIVHRVGHFSLEPRNFLAFLVLVVPIDFEKPHNISPIVIKTEFPNVDFGVPADCTFGLQDLPNGAPRISEWHCGHWQCRGLPSLIHQSLSSPSVRFIEMETPDCVLVLSQFESERAGNDFLKHRKGKHIMRQPEECVVRPHACKHPEPPPSHHKLERARAR